MPLSKCRLCGGEKEIPEYRLGKSDFRCQPCVNAESAAYRLRRLSQGNPVRRSFVPIEQKRRDDSLYFARSYADPEKRVRHAARAAARYATRVGQLTKAPCEVCGAAEVEAHHDDYAKPLSVRWLCPSHHREHHAAERALRRAA